MRDAQCARSRLWLSQWFLVRPGVSPDTHIAHSGPLGKAHASGQSRQNRLRSGCIVGGSHKAVGDWCSRPLYSRAVPKRGDSLPVDRANRSTQCSAHPRGPGQSLPPSVRVQFCPDDGRPRAPMPRHCPDFHVVPQGRRYPAVQRVGQNDSKDGP